MENIREKLVELLNDAARICNKTDCCKCRYFTDYACVDKFLIDHLIANNVTVQEQGQWTENQNTTYDSTWGEDVYWYTYTCSVCGGEAMNNFSYCPFCGNPMLPQPPKGA